MARWASTLAARSEALGLPGELPELPELQEKDAELASLREMIAERQRWRAQTRRGSRRRSLRRASLASMTMAEPMHGGRHTRRALLVPAAGAVLGWGVAARPAVALVKGSAPPPKKAPKEKRTCTTIDECEEVGRQREGA